MYPAAGVIIWIMLGGIVGLLTGKVTHTDGPHGTMANIGVGGISAVLAGFITTVAFNGEKSDNGFWLAIVIAAVTAVLSVSMFRYFYPGRMTTLR